MLEVLIHVCSSNVGRRLHESRKFKFVAPARTVLVRLDNHFHDCISSFDGQPISKMSLWQ